MPVIDATVQETLRQRFAESLRDEVTIKPFTQSAGRGLLTIPGRADCQFCAETQELVQELAELSPLLKLEVYDFYGEGAAMARKLGVERIPALVLGDGVGGRVKLYGIPMGYEFATLLESIEALSQGTPRLQESVVQAAQESILEAVRLQVFVTPT